jgi:hypothetical protein
LKPKKQRAIGVPSVVAPSAALTSARARRSRRVAIYVGPQTRDGFVDVDRGVLDSIKDLKSELRGKKRFLVVEARDRAQLVLEVLSRGVTSTGAGGAVAMPIGTMTMMLPVGTIGLTTVLRVGPYEKLFVFSNCGHWRHCAESVAKDLDTWLEANAATLGPQ